MRLTQGQASASALEIAGGGREHLLARGRDAMDVAEVNGDGQIPLSVDEVAERRVPPPMCSRCTTTSR